MDPALQAQWRNHLRHLRVIAAVADAHGDLVLEVDALDLLQKTMHKMLARLLAVANDVQPRVFLLLDPQQRRIRLGLLQFGALHLPLRPELFGLGKPGRFGQAAGNGGLKQRG